jgi:hypothetical protein
MTRDLRKAVGADEGASQLLHLRDLIQNARQRALRAVDTVQVQTCWEIGRHIVEFEQGGSARAEYGTRLLQSVASSRRRVREGFRHFESKTYAGVLSSLSNSRRIAS